GFIQVPIHGGAASGARAEPEQTQCAPGRLGIFGDLPVLDDLLAGGDRSLARPLRRRVAARACARTAAARRALTLQPTHRRAPRKMLSYVGRGGLGACGPRRTRSTG